ncbi:hypothetical protein OROGR_003136 [Orobanche gracilis]
MKVIFNVQEVTEFVENGYDPLPENPPEERAIHKDAKKSDQRALLFIHQCVDSINFEKISESETSNEAWDLLKKYYGGDDKVKKVRIQTNRCQYELLQMKQEEPLQNTSQGRHWSDWQIIGVGRERLLSHHGERNAEPV